MSYNFLGRQSITETQRVPQFRNNCFKHKHVILVGLEDQIKLKEYLASHRIIFEIHDRDEVKKSEVTEEKQYITMKENEPEEEVVDPKAKGKPAPKKPPPPVKKEEPKKKEVPKKKGPAGAAVNISDITLPPVKEYNKDELGQAEFLFTD